MANHAKQNKRKIPFRRMILLIALVVSLVGSTSTTTAGIFVKGTARKVYLTKNSLTITLTGDQSSKIYPGMNVDLASKATVTIPANQPACYVFLKITEANDTNDIVSWTMGTNFQTNPETGIYRSASKSTNASAQTLPVFSNNRLTIATGATLEQIQAATTTPITITIQACAVQSANISEAEALTLAKKQFS